MKKEFMQAAPEVLRQFLIYDEAIKNKASSSIDEYFRDLQTFFRYIKLIKGRVLDDTNFDRIEINDVDIDLIKTIKVTDLYSYLVFCKDDRNNNSTTRARKVSSLKQFFKYITVQTHQLEENPAELLESPKLKKSLPKHLTLENSLELLNSVKESDSPNSIRDYCIITLFLNCGMRLSEL